MRSRKVGSDSFFGESVPAISYSMRFGLAAPPPSSADPSTSKRLHSVTSVSVHYTVDLGSTNFSIPNTSRCTNPPILVLISSRLVTPPPTPVPSRPVPVTTGLYSLTIPTQSINQSITFTEVCIFQHVVCSFVLALCRDLRWLYTSLV